LKKWGWVVGLMLFLSVNIVSVSAQLGGNLTVNDSESATVTVNVSSKIMVDVTPATFSWSAVNPGSVADSTKEASGYSAIQIENIGSANITHVWFNATYPASRPFGTGNPSIQNAGNFVVLSRRSTNTSYWAINLLEYNETQVLYYIKDVAGNMPPNNSAYRYGRFHNASGEYFWMINKVSACHTGATIYIGKVAHTKTVTGSTNFNVPANYDSFALTNIGDATFGYADITSGPLAGLCVAVSSDCNRVFFSKWNADKPFHKCANVNYAWTTTDGKLVPGNSFAMGIKAYIPYGTTAGSSTGRITAIVNAV
jgi:hypothetical protein